MSDCDVAAMESYMSQPEGHQEPMRINTCLTTGREAIEALRGVTDLTETEKNLISSFDNALDCIQLQGGALEKAYKILRQTQALLKHKGNKSCNCDGCSWVADYEDRFEK